MNCRVWLASLFASLMITDQKSSLPSVDCLTAYSINLCCSNSISGPTPDLRRQDGQRTI